ncbi:MAG: response regulator transcription factor [Clostridia bacterium]|nr:response regulator transcription factor [Clostridia bacterium]
MVYIVEDDNTIRELIVYTLEQQNIQAKGFALPSDFWKALKVDLPEVIILDIMLPEENGLEMLRKLRNTSLTKGIPIMMLTAKGSEYDKVMGLDAGADDYVAKPFGMMELISRIKALMRRAGSQEQQKEFKIKELYVSPAKHLVMVEGEEIQLTFKEYELLFLFIENRGIVFSRDQLLRKIWDYSFDGENRTVDVHIRNLRMKLGSAGDLIQTVRGIGYKIEG